MKDSQKVYIRGNQDRGSEVIKMLEDLGGKKPPLDLGEDPSYIYFISHEGDIGCMLYESEVGKIIMDFYSEIKLPEQWKDGDVLISVESNERFAVYASAYYNRDDACRCYMYADDECDEIDTEDCNILRRFYRLATPSEFEHFHELMHKHGKDWDAEKKQVVDWRWKPNEHETYWSLYISEEIIITSHEWDNDSYDKKLFDFGNCFRTREEAEAAVDRVKKELKGE